LSFISENQNKFSPVLVLVTLFFSITGNRCRSLVILSFTFFEFHHVPERTSHKKIESQTEPVIGYGMLWLHVFMNFAAKRQLRELFSGKICQSYSPIRQFAENWRIGNPYLPRSEDLYSPIRQFADDTTFSK